MKTKFLIGFAVVTMTLAGCETMQQQPRRLTSADDPSNSCFRGMDIDPRFKPLVAKLGTISRADQASIEMMASTDKPTPEEKTALSIWGASRQECTAMGRSFRSVNAPNGWASAYESQQSAVLQAIARLYSGDITYGQFIIERQRIATIAAGQFADISGRDSQARAQHAQQEAARADAALQMMLIQQQQNRPITTNCNRFGNNVNCTTR